jgi:DNA polymerase-4
MSDPDHSIETPLVRKIIHIDMDCFYAAVEMRDAPELASLPIAVGGAADKRGVISTCNYIAREFGVHSAMATGYALKLCPNLVVVPGRMSFYKEISKSINEIFHRYTDIIEPLSLDEAFLDVTGSTHFDGSATRIAADIRRTISHELNLTASAGVAPNKFLAKICSDENKPDGQCVVTPDEVDEFVRKLSLKKIPGVGKVTVKRLASEGLHTCDDARNMGEEQLVARFGRLGRLLHKRCYGIDDRQLTTKWVRKSLSVERTFAEDVANFESVSEILGKLYEELERRLEPHDNRTIRNQQIKMKFADFQSTTIERGSESLTLSLFQELLPQVWQRGHGRSIRLLGLGVGFKDEQTKEEANQMSLF